MSNIAFIGLGNMGLPMAANLVKAGHAVAGFDLVDAAKQAAAASGVSIAASAREAVAQADAVVTMLPAGKHVLAAHADFLSAAPKGALIIDCSTIDVDSAKKAHEAGAAAGVLTLDAPVSGGVGGATAGTLTFMCGGSDEAFAKAEPILENMGKRIVHCGGAGAGQAAKNSQQHDPRRDHDRHLRSFCARREAGLIGAGFIRRRLDLFGPVVVAFTTYCPVPGPAPASPADRDYKPGFAASLMLKDLRLAPGGGGQRRGLNPALAPKPRSSTLSMSRPTMAATISPESSIFCAGPQTNPRLQARLSLAPAPARLPLRQAEQLPPLACSLALEAQHLRQAAKALGDARREDGVEDRRHRR